MNRHTYAQPKNYPQNPPDDGFETTDLLADLHAMRAAHAEQFNYDPRAMTEDLIARFNRLNRNVTWATDPPAPRRNHTT